EALRPHVMGRFDDMLVAVCRHPVMLNYLDQRISVGPNSRGGKRRQVGLNENLAREVLELHTLGVGGSYTQGDVRELAELFTGYSFDRQAGTFKFNAHWAEPGPETVLGRRYGDGKPDPGEAEAALRDIARHPDTARHIGRKLAVHFVSDTPDEGLAAHVAEAFQQSEGHLPSVYAALLEHPAAWRDFGAKVKRPIELVASAMRATETRPNQLSPKLQAYLLRAINNMNQPIWQPPGPDGWPEEGAAWITPQGLSERLKFASKLGHILEPRRDFDPRVLAEAALGDALKPITAFAIGGAEARWEGFALLFASAEFNRR
ncbi:MAG: DUF1800 domain-containing protein, partial [Pseudomonadota bacterium]